MNQLKILTKSLIDIKRKADWLRWTSISILFFSLFTLYSCKAIANDEVVIVLCKSWLERREDKCPTQFVSQTYRMPASFVNYSPKTREYHTSGFSISLKRGYRADIDEFIEQQDKRFYDRGLVLDTIRIATKGTENIQQFIERVMRVRPFKNEFSKESEYLASLWIYDRDYKVLRARPIEKANELPFPVDILPLDDTPVFYSCMNDPAMHLRVGCQVHDFSSSIYDLTYSYQFSTMNEAIAFSRTLRRIMDSFVSQ